MEALGIFKFWRHTAAGADVSFEDETDDDDSLFDLAFKSPDGSACGKHEEDLNEFIESPRDVFLTKTDLSSPVDKPLSPVSMLRPAPKFKVFMLGFKKSPRSEKTEAEAAAPAAPVFGRDNSLRSKMLRENRDFDATSSEAVSPSEKSVPKYLKLIKPFYAKASSKTRSADSVAPSSSPVTSTVNLSPKKLGEVSRVGSFKIMTRSLGKSRSASAMDGAAPPSIRRRDDSLLEQQNDGIQGAILHCKKSYSSSSQRDLSHLCRAASETSHAKLMRNSCEEQKRCSI